MGALVQKADKLPVMYTPCAIVSMTLIDGVCTLREGRKCQTQNANAAMTLKWAATCMRFMLTDVLNEIKLIERIRMHDPLGRRWTILKTLTHNDVKLS